MILAFLGFAMLAGGGEGAKKVTGKAEPAAEKKVAAPAPKDEPADVRITGSGYLEKLQVEEKEGTFGALRMKARAVPDAYRYLMAEGMEKIEKTGIGGPPKVAKLKSLCSESRSKKNLVLLLVDIWVEGADTYIILRTTLKSHLILSLGSPLSYSLQVEGAPPPTEVWKVFGYPPGTTRWTEPRMKLCVFKKIRLRLTVAIPKDRKKDEIGLSLKDAVVQTKSDDAASSIRTDLRQLSLRRWEDITIQGAVLNFSPARWDIPEPPAGFDELLERLEKR
jgi:hypothetical protein